jgi:1,2-diacylglycerol 3-alpha-glucosyltransferase
MKILMVSDVYFPRVNGVSSSIRTFATELVRLGHEVTIVAPEYPESHVDDGLEVIRLPSSFLFFDPEDRLITRAALRGAVAMLERRHFDVIHVQTPFRAHALGVRLARRTGAAVLETYHTYFEPYAAHYLPWLPARVLRYATRGFSRRLCREVDHLVVPTREMTEVLRGYGIDTPASIIPTGVDLEAFAQGDGARFRRINGIDARAPTIVTVSRLAREKNIDFLLEVARRLVADVPDLIFIVAGEGPDAERLRDRANVLGIASNVRFFGNLERSGPLLDCYRAGDVFVFASPTETQGLVLIEAMALGVPIVSTAVMGTATVLAGTRSARVSEEDPATFAAHVAILLREPTLRAALAHEGPHEARRWAAKGPAFEMVALYASLLESRQGLRAESVKDLDSRESPSTP